MHIHLLLNPLITHITVITKTESDAVPGFKKKIKNHGFVLITRHLVNIHLANRYVVSSILQVTLRMGGSKGVVDEFPHVSFRLLYVIVKKLKVADSRGGERTPPPGPPPSAPPPPGGAVAHIQGLLCGHCGGAI